MSTGSGSPCGWRTQSRGSTPRPIDWRPSFRLASSRRSLASDARGVWVGHLSSTGVLLIDPASNQVVAAVPATEAPNQLAWITLVGEHALVRALPTE